MCTSSNISHDPGNNSLFFSQKLLKVEKQVQKGLTIYKGLNYVLGSVAERKDFGPGLRMLNLVDADAAGTQDAMRSNLRSEIDTHTPCYTATWDQKITINYGN